MDRFCNRRPRWTECRPQLLWAIAGVVILTLILVTTLVLAVLKGNEELVKGMAEQDRIECPGLSESDCEKHLCHYNKVVKGPDCFMERDSFGFRVQKVSGGGSSKLTVHLKSIAQETPYGKSLENVVFTLTPINENTLRFQFKDENNSRYEVPVQHDFPLLQNPKEGGGETHAFVVEHSEVSEVFNFQLKRKDDGEVLWNSSVGGLLLSDQFLQISSYLPSDNVYGLGEHVHRTLRHDLDFVTWPMFSVDRPPETKDDYRNLYGVHPFYTCLEFSGKSHGVLFLNSNAMDVSFMPAPAVTFRTIGGILDFFVFVGDDPEHVVQLYTALIGKPVMPPYWSLGFQLSRYGHKDLNSVKQVVERTRKAGIPQTVQHLDIDHMEDHMDFTVDNQTYSGLKDYIQKTSKEFGLKWIMILDPAIAHKKGYEVYESGSKESVFIKRSGAWPDSMFPKNLRDVNATFGKVWPSPYVAFPDFFREETKEWWMKHIEKHRETLPFDGLWIDMNEPANFETNEERPPYCKQTNEECWSLKCPRGAYEDPPYNPMERTYLEGDKQHRLSWKTLCMDSVQGKDSEPFRHYDVHSLYGWSQTQPTLEAAQKATGKRSLVFSRSTYPSSGRYAGHWLGDNFSTFEDMRRSIIGMLEFNLFGIPYVGADVCGFNWDTSDELCKRWMQLGAFYPFYRNHNAIGQKDQDPAILKDDGPELSRTAVKRRLCLNPYLYTLFYRAHVDGSTVVRPLFHEFPTDKTTWAMDQEFMWGKSILVTPLLEPDSKNFSKYLPEGNWWLFDEEKSRKEILTGRFVKDGTADRHTPAHIRGGTVLPYADLENTTDYGEYPKSIVLYIFPSGKDEAEGELFVDNGETKNTIKDKKFCLYKFKYHECTLAISKEALMEDKDSTSPTLKSVVVFQVDDIGVAYSKNKNHTYKRFQEFNSVRIDVEDSLDTFTELRWGDADKKCKMVS